MTSCMHLHHVCFLLLGASLILNHAHARLSQIINDKNHKLISQSHRGGGKGAEPHESSSDTQTLRRSSSKLDFPDLNELCRTGGRYCQNVAPFVSPLWPTTLLKARSRRLKRARWSRTSGLKGNARAT